MTLRTTNAALWLLGAVLVALPAHAQGTDCEPRQLPSLDCIGTPNSECCKPFEASDNKTRMCDHAYYWYYLSQGMTPTRAQQHNSAYHMQTETFTGWPDALYDGGSTWSRHFIDVALFAGTIYESGKSWHSPNLDYSPLARARSNPFHQDFSTLQVTRLDGDGEPGARWTSNFWDDGSIRLSCDYFHESPVLQAAILLHESWHGVYGGHDYNGQDAYYPRTKDMIPAGEMDRRFVPLNWDDGSNAGWQQSVYQTELYFICDIMDMPARWLTNRTIAQARYVYPELRGRLADPSPDIVCGVNSLRASQDLPIQPAPGVPPRVIKMRVLGQLTDGTPLGEATHHPIDFSSETEIVSGVGFEGFPLQVYRSAKDDTEFRFFAEARLVDNETVEVRFQGEFYEDPPDCEGDTSPDSVLVEGQQCKGLEGREFWRRFTLNSREPVPPPITFDLSNCWDETEAGQCEDFAQGTIAFEIDW